MQPPGAAGAGAEGGGQTRGCGGCRSGSHRSGARAFFVTHPFPASASHRKIISACIISWTTLREAQAKARLAAALT